MSLDIWLMETKPTNVHEQNITHNLGKMAEEAGMYRALWRPEEANVKTASDLIPVLEKGIGFMEKEPDHFRQFDAPNGWGTYEQFLPWLKRLLGACREHPTAKVEVSR